MGRFLLFGFGSGIGTSLHRASRLLPYFWIPLVAGSACLVSYLLFYVYLLSPDAGRLASRFCWIASVAVFVWHCRDADTRILLRQRDTWLPALLTVLLMASFMASAFAMPIGINDRFRFALPPDNMLPRMFAERLYRGAYGLGVPPAPLDVDWRSSDRPPLQAAIIVAALPLRMGDRERFYQFVATLCQMGWIADCTRSRGRWCSRVGTCGSRCLRRPARRSSTSTRFIRGRSCFRPGCSSLA